MTLTNKDSLREGLFKKVILEETGYPLPTSNPRHDKVYWTFEAEELLTYITSHIEEAERRVINKDLELMKDIMAENFHYRLLCGEIRDPDGEINVHREFIRYQELEPERIKFADYIEKRKKQLNSTGGVDDY